MRTLSPLAAAAALIPLAALAYEEPSYQVVQRLEGFEVRRYPPHIVAETTSPGSFKAARNEAFRRLFAFISGANASRKSIAMTVPVVTAPAGAGEKLEMTVPVTTVPDGEGGFVMQFVVPARFTLEDVPRPNDPRVQIRQAGERWVAVRRYSGRSSEANYRENERELLARMAAAGLPAAGAALLAVYNGPFTPWFLRRNEVQVPVEPPR